MNKKGSAIAEGIGILFNCIIVSFLALVIFGASTLFYSYQVDVKNSEALIMTKTIMDCVSPQGIFTVEKVKSMEKEGIFYSCINAGTIKNRFFVRMIMKDAQGKEVGTIQDGDEGALWVKELFSDNPKATETIKQYRPGYFKQEFMAYYHAGNEYYKGNLTIEVLVKDAS